VAAARGSRAWARNKMGKTTRTSQVKELGFLDEREEGWHALL